MEPEDYIIAMIKVELASRKWTEFEFSKKVGMSVTWLWNKLEGRRPFFVHDLFMIAKGFGLNARDLLPSKDDISQGQKIMEPEERNLIAAVIEASRLHSLWAQEE